MLLGITILLQRPVGWCHSARVSKQKLHAKNQPKKISQILSA